MLCSIRRENRSNPGNNEILVDHADHSASTRSHKQQYRSCRLTFTRNISALEYLRTVDQPELFQFCGPFLEIHAEPYILKVRARPASAQPSSRAPTTTTSCTNAVGGSSRRRKEYWPRHLPPPWNEHSNNGDCSSRSGSCGGGEDDGGDGYYRRRGSRPASSGKRARVPTVAVPAAAAAANLELRARMGAQSKWWDGSCAVGMDVGARRALAARVAAAAVEAGEVRRETSASGFGFNEGAFIFCSFVLCCHDICCGGISTI